MEDLRPCILIVEGAGEEYDRLANAIRTAGRERDRWGGEDGGVRLERLRTGEAAVRFLNRLSGAAEEERSRWPHVLLLEATLPGLGGLRLLEWIRSVAKLRRLPVVLLTDRPDPELAKEAYEAGANSCLRKPRDDAELARWAQAVLKWWCTWNVLPEPTDAYVMAHGGEPSACQNGWRARPE